MLDIIEKELAVPRHRIMLAVNRYEKSNTVDIADIRKSLANLPTSKIPNQYKLVSESVNVGTPLYGMAPTSPIVQAITELARELGGIQTVERKGILSRAFGQLLGA